MTEAGHASFAGAVLAELARLDREWMIVPAGHDDVRSVPWMPFPMHDFIALVAEALPEAGGDRFLEIGCGIGTRMKAASVIFGLDVHGVERVPEYAAEAVKLGMDAEVTDALTYDGYGKYDIIWFNRPFRDPELQRQLEARVWDQVASGAVVICANLEAPPPANWWPVLNDSEVRRWIAQKP